MQGKKNEKNEKNTKKNFFPEKKHKMKKKNCFVFTTLVKAIFHEARSNVTLSYFIIMD